LDSFVRINVSDHGKPASKYRNDPVTQGCGSRHFSSKQARYKVLLSGLFERKIPLDNGYSLSFLGARIGAYNYQVAKIDASQHTSG
jgi:hypothetical protein